MVWIVKIQFRNRPQIDNIGCEVLVDLVNICWLNSEMIDIRNWHFSIVLFLPEMLKLSLLEKLTILGVYFRIIRSHAIHCLSWVLDTLESIHQNCCICVRILITSTVRIPVPGYSQSQEENVMYFHRKEPFLLYPVSWDIFYPVSPVSKDIVGYER